MPGGSFSWVTALSSARIVAPSLLLAPVARCSFSGRGSSVESEGLCGLAVCRRLCSRVQHCPAGQARVRWLWQLREAERAVSRPRPFSYTTWPASSDTQGAFKSQTRHPWSALNRPQRKPLREVYTPRCETFSRPPFTGGTTGWFLPRHIKPLSSRVSRIVLVVLLSIVAAYLWAYIITDHYQPAGLGVGIWVDTWEIKTQEWDDGR